MGNILFFKDYTEKSTVKFIEYLKSRGYKRYLNKELYNFRNL